MVFVLALKAMTVRPWRHPFFVRVQLIVGKVGKKPCMQRTYSANLRIRRCFGTMSRAVVPGAAERCGRALPEEIKACLLAEGVGRCGAVRRAGTSQSAHWLRANRALRHASGAPRVAVLGFWTTARPTSDSRLAGWGPTRRCLASDALGAG